MKNKLLILSLIFLATANTGAAQKETHGSVPIHHPPSPVLRFHDLSSGEKKVGIELNITTTNPYELDEMSFNKGQFIEAAHTFILVAVH